MVTDVSTWPGVAALWPNFTPLPWSAEAVAQGVTDFITEAAPPGVQSVYSAKPLNWDASANFYGDSQPFGVGAFVYVGPERQSKIRTGTGVPERDVTYDVTFVGLFRSTLRDTAAAQTLQRRIEDGIKQAIRNSPNLGGRAQNAGVKKLSANRDTPTDRGQGMEIWFHIDFEVTVVAPPMVSE